VPSRPYIGPNTVCNSDKVIIEIVMELHWDYNYYQS